MILNKVRNYNAFIKLKEDATLIITFWCFKKKKKAFEKIINFR